MTIVLEMAMGLLCHMGGSLVSLDHGLFRWGCMGWKSELRSKAPMGILGQGDPLPLGLHGDLRLGVHILGWCS